jgi:hypothetical protein
MITGHLEVEEGAGIWCGGYSSISITHCTLADNLALDGGAGIYCTSSTAEVINTILWNEGNSVGSEIWMSDFSDLNISYSDVEGGNGLVHAEPGSVLDWDVMSMIEMDPLFDAPGNGDYHLTALSGCINMGSNGTAHSEDIDGDPVPFMGTADMGADEFAGVHTLESDVFALIEGTGGQVHFTLHGGDGNGGRGYLVLGSVTGTFPGTPLPGGKATLAVNWDIFTGLVLSLLNTPIFSDFNGFLGPDGSATAAFDTLGPVPGASGLNLSFAFALYNEWDFVSNPVNIKIESGD